MLEYTKDDDIDFALFVGESEVPLEEWLETLKSYNDKGCTGLELYDLSSVTGILTNSDVRAIASLSDSLKNSRPMGSKTAIVVTKPIHRWLVRFYTILSQVAKVNWETRQFSTVGDAAKWLGIHTSIVEKMKLSVGDN